MITVTNLLLIFLQFISLEPLLPFEGIGELRPHFGHDACALAFFSTLCTMCQ